MNNRMLAATTVIPLAVIGCTAPSEQKPLNIIHIMSDDHSFQAISAYGHPLSQLAPTPNIDRLAREGMIFSHAYVENSLSTPSRACLMTGLYSHQNGQRTLFGGLDTTKTFFSELLQENGYQTAVVGKWHMQCEPKGFDYYAVLPGQGAYYNPKFKTSDSNGKFVKEDGYATTLITDYAIDFLENRDRSKPFCMLVHHKAPHRNWIPDPKYYDLYEDVVFPMPDTFYDDYSTRCEPAHSQEMRIDEPWMNLVADLKLDELKDSELCKDENDLKVWKGFLKSITPEQREALLKSYGEKNKEFLTDMPTGRDLAEWKYQRYIRDYMRCIKSIDDEVGRLVDYLEKEGLLENTVIVYTSDQGFFMGEHGWFDKRFMYEESFRTPLIIMAPGHVKAGAVCDALVQNIDFAPTYLDIAGVEKPEYMEGTSLIPLFGGNVPEDWREYLYYHYYHYPAYHMVRKHDGVRDERYKLIHFYGEGHKGDSDINCNEFYDLQADPKELNNLYGNPEYQSEIDRLQKRLDRFRADLKVDEF